MKSQRLDSVCLITMGQAPPGDSYNTDGNGYPLVAGAGDFSDGKIAAKKHTTEPGKISDEGDVILGIRASIGVKVLSDGQYCLGRGVAGLKPLADLDLRYLWQWLGFAADELAAKGRGATFLQVNRNDIGEMGIPLPSLPEQKRIAAVLDQVDILRAKRREVIALLDDLTQSIFLDMFGDPSMNSCGFEVRELEALVAEGDRINYGVVQPGRHVEGGIPLIRSGDLGRFGVDRSSLMQISPEIESSYSRSRIKGNEILVGCVGAIGEVSIVGPDDVGSNVARAVARVPVAGDVDREYLAAYLRTDFAQHYFTRELRTVAQPTLNIKQIKSAPVMFPPSHLRSAFAERSRSVAQQRAVHVTHLAALDELFTSLQHRAFSGALWDHEALDEAA